MILDAILSFICAVPNLLLDSLTVVGNLVIPEGIFNWWQDMFSNLTYIFPIYALIPIITTSLGIKFFQIFWVLVIRGKSFIPTMRCLIQNWWQRTAGVAPICMF